MIKNENKPGDGRHEVRTKEVGKKLADFAVGHVPLVANLQAVTKTTHF